MPARDLPARPNLEQYKKQAKELLKQWKASDPQSTQQLADAQHVIARDHGFDSWKTFSDEIAKRTGAAEKAAILKAAEAALVAGDDVTLDRFLREHEKLFRTEGWYGGLRRYYEEGGPRALIARGHFFNNWDEFSEFANELKVSSSPVARFERAADAIVTGDIASLAQLLSEDRTMIRARSRRTHHAMLLHYVGSNGIEGWRQQTPQNIVEITNLLLDAGAEIDAKADMYGGGCTTLGLAATSIHPKDAGVLRPLLDALLARGAQVDAKAGGNASLIVNSCLANGRPEAAEYLSTRGAPIDLEAAAGVGRIDLVKAFFTDGSLKPPATVEQLKDGFTWACEYGKTDVVEFLLDHGVEVGEVLPRHHKQTGLHWAAYGGHVDTVTALLRRGAPVDGRDASFSATPLGWAMEGWWNLRDDPTEREPYYQVVALLVAAGAPLEPEWVDDRHSTMDPRMLAALLTPKS